MGAAQADSASESDRSSGDRAIVTVAISSCLLGERVRYNGEHRKAVLLVAEMTPDVRWLPVCPEVEAGMGVPREPVQLVEEQHLENGPAAREEAGRARPCRLVGVESGRDWTAPMEELTAIRAADLEELGVSGYIFKSRSPSCGLKGVPVHGAENAPERSGPGLFAAAMMTRFPDLPVAEEADLVDAPACREFLRRVLEYRRRRR